MLYKQYWFWLMVISAIVFLLERIAPWRKKQRALRPQLLQDFFWLAFNGYLFGRFFVFILKPIKSALFAAFESVFRVAPTLDILHSLPLIAQVLMCLIFLDFIEWCVHNMLHRIGFLWSFHRVHHSIHTMDWIGNFRFHWMELIIYNTFKFLPIALVIGNRWEVLLWVAIISTFVGHLNHSNLFISWGPLRYIFNSPRMHIWHHDKRPSNKVGYNFGIVLSCWDWIFGTAYMPLTRTPEALGFRGDERFPDCIASRFFAPFIDRKS